MFMFTSPNNINIMKAVVSVTNPKKLDVADASLLFFIALSKNGIWMVDAPVPNVPLAKPATNAAIPGLYDNSQSIFVMLCTQYKQTDDCWFARQCLEFECAIAKSVQKQFQAKKIKNNKVRKQKFGKKKRENRNESVATNLIIFSQWHNIIINIW